MSGKKRFAHTAVGLLLLMFVAACGADPTGPTADQPTSPPVTSEPATPTPVSPSPTAETPPTVVSGSATPTGPPIVVANPGERRQTLLLSDAFDKGEWVEGSYTPANETTTVNNAMAVDIYCGSKTVKSIEYCFAQMTGTIQIAVAQDMRSEASDAELEFSLMTDGRQIEAKNIDFTGKAVLSADLAGVTVLKVGVRPTAEGACQRQNVNALITSIVIER